MVISDDGEGLKRISFKGPASIVNELCDDIWRLTVARLVSAEESEAMHVFVKELRDLEKRLFCGTGVSGPTPAGSVNMVEMEGMIRILRNDIGQVMMRNIS